ncbi:MAG: hypothetical protein IKK24_01015, partial [Clostridia bacterium]|nr:hypothetical protein [Clostridia bacterium]
YYDLTSDGNNWSDGIGAISMDAVGNKVNSDAPTLKFLSHSQENDVVLTFTAPYAGIVNVSMDDKGIFAPHNGDDVVRFEMLHNGAVIESCYNLDNSYNGNPFFAGNKALIVEKGDTIRFVVGRNKPNDGTTYLSPNIAYIEACTDINFNAVEDFDTQNNPSGVWTYQEQTAVGGPWITLPAGGDMYGDGGTPGGWIAKVDSDLVTGWPAIVMASNGTPWAVSSVFKAPYSGTINIKMANGGVFAPYVPADTKAATFDMSHNGVSKVSGAIDASNCHANRLFADTVTLNVKAGDEIRFAVGMAVGGYQSYAYFNPDITYTSLDFTTFNAVDDYTTKNNPCGFWTYQEQTAVGGPWITLPAGGDMYGDGGTPGGWIAKVDSDLITGAPAIVMASNGTPWAVSSVFKAPYSGTINIKMANGGVFAPHVPADTKAATFDMSHNGVSKVSGAIDSSNRDGNTFFADTVTLNVKAGDEIRFAVGMAVGGYQSYAYFNPEITYTDIIKPEVTTGNSYYFSTSGQDYFTGTNPYAPWYSLSKLANIDLKPGDKVYFKAGDTFTEQVVLKNLKGTEDNPIVFTSYGEGAQPKFDLGLAEDPSTGLTELAVPVILVENSKGVVFDNLAVTGSGVGIELYYNNSFNNKYVKIKNCTFTDITGFHQVDNRDRSPEDRYYVASAIVVTVTNNTWAVNDPPIIGLYIENCLSNNCGTLFSQGGSHLGTNEGGSYHVNGLYIKDCVARNNDYYGIYVAGTVGGYIDGCVIEACGDAESFGAGTAGILLAATDFKVINTKVEKQQRGGVNYDGVAIDLERDNNNVTIKNCYFKENTGAAFLIYNATEGMTCVNKNITITENIFEENATQATGTGSDANVDIRILSGAGCALESSVISNNIWFTNVINQEFIQYAQLVPPTVENVFENNDFYEDDYTYNIDTALSAAVAEEYVGYDSSNYTADVRKGYSSVNGQLVVTDTFKHTEVFTKGDVWKHQFHVDGAWQDMTMNGDHWDFGAGGFLSNTALFTPVTGLSAIIFEAPEAGRVRIGMELALQLLQASTDGTYVTIANENRELLCDPISLDHAGTPYVEFTPFYYNVAKGEKIYFMLSKREENGADGTQFTPVVEYVDAYGSVDSDDAINILDFIRLKKYAANNNSIEINAAYADINGDGEIEAIDITKLKKYLLGA